MTDYNKATNFATKDALVTGDPLKVVKGTEIDDELNAIEDAIETKANIASPTFTGIPKAPTAATGTNTTQIATTAFVKSSVDSIDLTNSIGADDIIDNSIGADELNVDGDGIVGQFLISDGDGSFSWTAIALLSPAAEDPTARDDATALAEGDLYYNTAEDKLFMYDGTTWRKTDEETLPEDPWRFSVDYDAFDFQTASMTVTEKYSASGGSWTVDAAGYYMAITQAYQSGTSSTISVNGTQRYFVGTVQNAYESGGSGVSVSITTITPDHIDDYTFSTRNGTSISVSGYTDSNSADQTSSAIAIFKCEVDDVISFSSTSPGTRTNKVGLITGGYFDE